MERYFILDKFNTWSDWRLILTAKSITPPEPKTNYVELDGMNGSLDLTEALSGEVTYKNRTVLATFWTNEGTRDERTKLLRDITTALHGRKIKVIEPDDPEHYFLGRAVIKSVSNSRVYAEFTIEIICDPYRYFVEEFTRVVNVVGQTVNTVITNNGTKKLSPVVTVTGDITVTFDDVTTELSTGSYTISSLKLSPGANVVGVSGNGSITFKYREVEL